MDKLGARLFTTPKGREAEISLAASLSAGRGQGNQILSSESEYSARLASYEARQSAERGMPFKLSSEQSAAARNVLMHGDAFQGIQGEAGTGKTAALAFVREVAEAKGWRVLGMATSASAADELGRSSGIDSSTVASFFANQANQARLIRQEIHALTTSLDAQRAGGLAAGSMVEYRRVNAPSLGSDADSRAYTFDHKRGVVFRMNNGLMGAAGVRLLDFAQDTKDRPSPQHGGTTLVETLGARASALSGRMAEWVGLRLADFQKVEGEQAIEARTALAAQGGSAQQLAARQLGLKKAELRNLETYGDRTGKQTLLVMDETSLTGAADLAKLASLARSISARAVLQGDTKQHSSPAAGRAFAQAQSFGMNTSILKETMRFGAATDQVKTAHVHMQLGNFAKAYESLDARVVEPADLAKSVAQRFVELVQKSGTTELKAGQVGVAAMTNADRRSANAAIHVELQAAGLIGPQDFEKTHLQRPKLTKAEHHFASAIQSHNVTHLLIQQRTDGVGLARGTVVEITGFDVAQNLIHAKTEAGRALVIDPSKHEGFAAMIKETRSFSTNDRIEAREVIRTTGQKRSRISNGTRGKIVEIDASRTVVLWDDGRKTQLTNDQARSLDHSYARTTFKEQGATNQHELLMISANGAKIFNREAAYVGATRAKLNTEIITSDQATLVRNAGNDVSKPTALTALEVKELVKQSREQRALETRPERSGQEVAQKPQRLQQLTRD